MGSMDSRAGQFGEGGLMVQVAACLGVDLQSCVLEAKREAGLTAHE
jgi:hypothetical protein